MRKDRLIVGLICIALAVRLFLSGATGHTVAPAIAIASRKQKVKKER